MLQRNNSSDRIAIGCTVKARTQRGIVTGEVIRINNRKITIKGDTRQFTENGREITADIDTTIVVFKRNVDPA